VDNCEQTPNPGQEDGNCVGIGDACTVSETPEIVVLASGGPLFPSSPVAAVVADPNLDSISATFNTLLLGSTYDTLSDYNSDTRRDEIASIPQPIAGAHQIRIVRKDGYPDSAKFTLSVRIDGNHALEPLDYRNVTISSIGTTVPDTLTYCPTVLTPGNCDGSSPVTVPQAGDIIYLVNHVFKSGSAPDPAAICDVNRDGPTTAADIIYLVNYIFKGGPKPCSISICSP